MERCAVCALAGSADRPVEPTSPVKPGEPQGKDPVPVPPQTPPVKTVPKIVKASQIRVDFRAPYLADEADVDRYVEELKKSLIAEIRDGNKVIV